MSSPITLSGFNNIDFGSIVTALMQIERQPVASSRPSRRRSRARRTFSASSPRSSPSLESAAGALLRRRRVSRPRRDGLRHDRRAAPACTSSTPIGSYEIVVDDLARAQVSVTDSTHADKDTTIVASGGTLIIGGVTVDAHRQHDAPGAGRRDQRDRRHRRHGLGRLQQRQLHARR